MKKLTYAIVAFFTFMCVPLCAQTADKKPTVVIAPFEAKSSGLGQDDCDIVTESFESEYARTGSALVVNRNTFKKIQAEQAFQNSDWSNSDKTAKLGEALNAQQLIFGSQRIYNDILFVIVQVQDIKTLAVLASVHIRVKNIMEVLEKIPDICKNIAAQMNGESAPATISKKAPPAINGENTPAVSKKTSSVQPAQTAKNEVDKVYKIGDIGPGGGYIFYASVSGFPVYSGEKMTICHYLECSPDEVGDRASWCPCTKSPWCKVETNTAIGAGKKNTENVLSANHSNETLYAFNCAAKACAEYSTKTTKAGEWYLPSKDELNLIYVNLIKTGIIKSSRWYWSSSQYNDNRAWVQSFRGGSQSDANKLDYLWYFCLRAVRAF